jgi:hypothetical protein
VRPGPMVTKREKRVRAASPPASPVCLATGVAYPAAVAVGPAVASEAAPTANEIAIRTDVITRSYVTPPTERVTAGPRRWCSKSARPAGRPLGLLSMASWEISETGAEGECQPGCRSWFCRAATSSYWVHGSADRPPVTMTMTWAAASVRMAHTGMVSSLAIDGPDFVAKRLYTQVPSSKPERMRVACVQDALALTQIDGRTST